MSKTQTASEQITAEVTAWPGVQAGPGRRGEFAFNVEGRDFSFPKNVWTELVEQERITEHPVFPGKIGPAARRIASQTDVEDVIALLRLNYDRLAARHPPSARAER